MEKQRARQTGLSARAAITNEQRAAYDAALLVRMKAIAQNASLIGCYVSMKDEADTHAFLNWCFQTCRSIAVPKVEGKTLGFYQISSMDELAPGVFGVLEPLSSHRTDPAKIDLMFIPLSSIDHHLNRTGYGKGYYDSVLTESMHKVGIAYPEQQVEEIDADPWDIPLDEIILPDSQLKRCII